MRAVPLGIVNGKKYEHAVLLTMHCATCSSENPLQSPPSFQICLTVRQTASERLMAVKRPALALDEELEGAPPESVLLTIKLLVLS